MGSKRLPGKVLLPLNGHTVIGEVLSRCKKIPGVDQVVCAIPETRENERLAAEVYDKNLAWLFRWDGPEDDVLARYYQAAIQTEADIIVRVTGDCPLICPELCGDVIEARNSANADYASNLDGRTFPRGYDCEVFTMDLLRQANYYADWTYYGEHVTPWMRKNAKTKASVQAKWKLEGRLTLDTEDDYKTICAYFGHKPYESRLNIRAA